MDFIVNMSGINGVHHNLNYPGTSCPCSPDGPPVQSFINNDYFCESGNHASDGSYDSVPYTSDPLWDGKGCGSLESTFKNGQISLSDHGL